MGTGLGDGVYPIVTLRLLNIYSVVRKSVSHIAHMLALLRRSATVRIKKILENGCHVVPYDVHHRFGRHLPIHIASSRSSETIEEANRILIWPHLATRDFPHSCRHNSDKRNRQANSSNWARKALVTYI